MKKQLGILSFIILLAVLPSCAPTSPKGRIDKRPQDYEKLSSEHKKLVLNGQIAKGMSKEAVALAWGSPGARMQGLRNNKPMERWDYRGQQPVMINPFFGGFNNGFFGYPGFGGWGGGIGTQVAYVPYRRASVWFLADKVSEWERMD